MRGTAVTTIGSLFSGIGGLDLGLEAAGVGQVVWQVEIDKRCRQVLAKHWPDAERQEDVKTVGSRNLGRVDVICGGFPCQDVSSAGKREGLSGAASGLWYEYERIVRELRPRAVVVENVSSGARKWLPTVRRMLGALGYRTRAITVAASDVGAPHLRRRIFVLAIAMADGDGDGERARESVRVDHAAQRNHADGRGQGPLAHRHRVGLEVDGKRRGRHAARAQLQAAQGSHARVGDDHRLPVGVVGRDADGLPGWMDMPRRFPAPPGPQHDWEPSRTVGQGTQKDRAARLKELGNAVVPHCGYVAGRALLEWMAEEDAK
jgi:DNA (cytosine-5)-methyltransferase 1